MAPGDPTDEDGDTLGDRGAGRCERARRHAPLADPAADPLLQPDPSLRTLELSGVPGAVIHPTSATYSMRRQLPVCERRARTSRRNHSPSRAPRLLPSDALTPNPPPLVVGGSSEPRGAPPRPRTAGSVGDEQCRPPLLLVVRSERPTPGLGDVRSTGESKSAGTPEAFARARGVGVLTGADRYGGHRPGDRAPRPSGCRRPRG
jgi:hypothetical protein